MKRSQINYAIDKAHAIAEAFRICLPEFAMFTADVWAKKRSEEWREVRDLQLGWDITDFGSGCFHETGLTLLTLRNGAPGHARYPKPYAKKCCRFSRISKPRGIFIIIKWKTLLIAAAVGSVCSWHGRRQMNSGITSAA